MYNILLRLSVCIGAALLFTGAYMLGTTQVIPMDEAQDITDAVVTTFAEVDGRGIFLNNVVPALLMFVPGVGILTALISAAFTGHVYAAMVTVVPELQDMYPPLSLLYATPYGLLELAAYSIAISRSMLLTVSLLRGKNILKEGKVTLSEIGLVVLLLVAGALVESYILET